MDSDRPALATAKRVPRSWETEFGRAKLAEHQYGTTGTVKVRVEVRDPEGLTHTTREVATGAYPDGTITDPHGPDAGTQCVIRGGSWDHRAVACRSALRGVLAPGSRGSVVGVRLARNAGWGLRRNRIGCIDAGGSASPIPDSSPSDTADLGLRGIDRRRNFRPPQATFTTEMAWRARTSCLSRHRISTNALFK